MPKVELHPLIKQIRGKLSEDFVLKLSPQGELILGPIHCCVPNMKGWQRRRANAPGT